MSTDAGTDDTLVQEEAGRPPPPSPRRRPAELERGAVVGRHVVLARLGAGGMGVVYAAYDPELDRKIALKLVLPGSQGPRGEAHSRLLREAQALARLSHPNVVAIHDVGSVDAQVWVAMEFVEGATLGAWLRERRAEGRHTWRGALEVMQAAGAGLAAAHAAGLLHRDFKPDNVMVGRDGRVRVMDFGLARPHAAIEVGAEVNLAATAPAEPAAAPALRALQLRLTDPGALAGTPTHMAPEQFRGAEITAAADQFAFCVTLWEALYGERPFAGETLVALAANVLAGKRRPPPRGQRVPGWLRRVCERGLAVEPGDRWPSMEALLRALGRGQAQARLRRWAVALGVVAAVAGGAEALRRGELRRRVAACAAEGAAIAEVWDAGARQGVRDGLLGTGVSLAAGTVDNVLPWLDRYAAAWSEGRTRMCMRAEVEGTLPPETLERARWCLDERRLELAALVGELRHPDAGAVAQAVPAATNLPRIAPCLDPAVLDALPAPPPATAQDALREARAELALARTLSAAGDPAAALDAGAAALARAEALGWPPLTTAARQLQGLLLERTGAYAEAEAASVAAYQDAARARAWEVAAEAALNLAALTGVVLDRRAEAEIWARQAEVMIALAGDPVGLQEAARLNILGNLRWTGGDLAAARALHDRALALREAALGPDHPDVAQSLNNLAALRWSQQDLDGAEALHARALRIREETLGPDHPDVALSLNNLAAIDHARGDLDQAQRRLERALRLREAALGPDHPDVATNLHNLASLLRGKGDLEGARAGYERALALGERALGPAHPSLAYALVGLAELALDQGRAADALALAERAVSLCQEDHPATLLCADAHYTVARALWETGGDRARALALARRAADDFVELADNNAAASVRHWLGERAGE